MNNRLPDQLARFKKRYPNMDLELVQAFAETMMCFHQVPILMESYFSRKGLSKARFGVMIQLHAIDDSEGMSIGELRDYYKVSSATITGVIDTLEGEGLIERVRSTSDRRKVNVRITEAGRRFMDEFLPVHQQNIRRFVGELSPAERETLLRLLGKLQNGIKAVLDEETHVEPA